MTSHVVGFAREPVTPQKQPIVTTTEKVDAALRAATLSFSPPISRQPSDEISVSPKTNGTALIAARAIGTGTSSPSRGNLSRDSSYDATGTTASAAYAGSLKAAQISASRSSSAHSGAVSRVKSNYELNPSKSERSNSEDVSSAVTQIDGSLIAAKISAAKDRGHPVLPKSSHNESSSSLLAAGLAVSRSTTPSTMATNQTDQEPDILPPAGSVNEAKKRLLQHTDTIDNRLDGLPRGRRSVDIPLRSKHSKTFSIDNSQTTNQISPLSAAKLAVQHSGRSAGASSIGTASASSRPRQPSPIKREIKHDTTPAPALKPVPPKKPTIQNIQITQPSPLVSPKPQPKKLIDQDTGRDIIPPPQPIKPLPRKTRGPERSSKPYVPDTSPSSTLDGPSVTKPLQKISSTTVKPQENVTKAAPPLPLPRGAKISTENSQPSEPVKQEPPFPRPKPTEPVKQEPLVVKPKPLEPVGQEIPIIRPKPDPPKPKNFVDSIVGRQPPPLYQNREQNASAATLPVVLPPPRGDWNRGPSSSRSVQVLRQNRTGPDQTRSPPRHSPNWRDDLPYNFTSPSEEYIRPAYTGDTLRQAIAASSLASSRAASPVKSNPLPLPPRPNQGFRTTMRSPEKTQERETSPHKRNNLLSKKHPNKHNEGARKRWREFVTEKERKRYEGLWAANKGLYMIESALESRPDTKGKNIHQEAICAVVVKDLWSRSRLPLDVLEQVWDLVDRGPQPKWWLTREEFIMGLWLIDQSLKGRKLPGRVQDGTWESVRRMGVVLKGYDELGLKEKNVKRK